ncbi:hypothetical protein [Legionella fallonii]|uniref:Putative OmpA-like transmembrane domain n=1 Tax=Legionella fallonii LLAP-10 TaxID=1212491 RepID=A0A098G2N7_9GAMM|nr:hypothetical protein [Legionella fallonii]CEG55750.1 putative OmpA-like transmembrane domain [Legionella fallonii LLAP-10]
MKKKQLFICVMGILANSAYAGTMGDVAVKDYFIPFVVGEAAVTWNTTESVSIFGNPPSLDKQLWGGRGAVGIAHSSPNRFGYTAEIGWGYYGSTSSSNSGTSTGGTLTISNDSYLYGFDLLAGVTYNFDPFQLYLKGGAMAENRRTKGLAVFNNVNNGKSYVSTNTINAIATNVLPEIKVGGLYSLNEHISLTLAYMHVFGNNDFAATVSGAFSNPSATTSISSVANTQNPSLDSLLFGLVYQFA